MPRPKPRPRASRWVTASTRTRRIDDSLWIGGARGRIAPGHRVACVQTFIDTENRSEEHTSELQSQSNLVCRLLLEKKKTKKKHKKSDTNNQQVTTPNATCTHCCIGVATVA